jgi:hypothetical protein
MKRKQDQIDEKEYLDSKEMRMLTDAFNQTTIGDLGRDEKLKPYNLVCFLVNNFEFELQNYSNDVSSSVK